MSTTDFKKILEHPERDKIISKLVNGEPTKDVAQYLKLKFNGKDDGNLRVPASLLQEFIDKYFDQYKFLDKIVQDEKAGKTDKIVFESLLNNKAWKDRVGKLADGKIDLKQKIIDLLEKLEGRAEQVFDKIQENPNNLKADYVMIKYFEMIDRLIVSANKIVNEAPDQVIQHNISVQMIEQHSIAFQEAIRELLLELDSDVSARFMDLLTAKLGALKPEALPIRKTIEAHGEEIKQLEVPILEDDDYNFEIVSEV